jgi:hypothetical protein
MTINNKSIHSIADGLILFFEQEGIPITMFSLTMDLGDGFLESDIRSRYSESSTVALLRDAADQYIASDTAEDER